MLAAKSLAPLLLAFTPAVPAPPSQDVGPFRELDFEAACRRARAEEKAVLVDFFTTWCPPCKRMDEVTWPDAAVRAWTAEHTVAIRVDAEVETELAERYRVEAYPTILLTDADGAELGRVVGFREPAELLSDAADARTGIRPSERLRQRLEARGGEDRELRLEYARALADEGRHAEALEQYLACTGRTGPMGMPDVSVLSDIGDLGEAYPPAHDALRERREVPRRALLAGTAGFPDAVEYAALNNALDDPRDTLAVWEALADVEPQKVGGVRVNARPFLFHEVFELLVEERRYAEVVDGVGGADPIARERLGLRMAESVGLPEEDPGMKEEMLGHLRRIAIDKGALYLEAALGTGEHDARAEELVTSLLELEDSPEVLETLEEHARRAGRADFVPRMFASWSESGGAAGAAVWIWNEEPAVDEAPAAREILNRMGRVYAEARTYRDTGTLESRDRGQGGITQRATFRTAFVRPDRFRFVHDDTTSWTPKRLVVWRDGDSVRRAWTILPDVDEPDSLGLAVAGAAGVTLGAAHTVPELLMGEEIGGRGLLDLSRPRRIADGDLDGRPCYRVEASAGRDRRTRVWVEHGTHLLLRVDVLDEDGAFSTERRTTYEPVLDADVPPEELDFDAVVEEMPSR